MDSPARVVQRYKTARWDNAVNGSRFSLLWNKTKWRIEETADGSIIPTTRGFGENLDLVAYEMPQLETVLKKYDTVVTVLPKSILQETQIRTDDSGANVRAKLAQAQVNYLKRAEQELRSDGRIEQADTTLRIIREAAQKLVWKKGKV
jgi:hypothetical protein